MYIQPYHADELKFAYCCHVYYRWQMCRRTAYEGLTNISAAQIEALRPDVHILNLESNVRELALLASLRPTDSIATGASKIKGGASKLLTQSIDNRDERPRFATGYFACTAGARTSEQLDRYLENQSDHHGYSGRANPPIYLRTWPAPGESDVRLQANHSHTCVKWHLVFSTWNRMGTFTAEAAEAVVDSWEELAASLRVRFCKVSFLPDHVHLAIRSHPAVVPAKLVPEFLNSSQILLRDQFQYLIIPTGNPRVWKPSAYVGTFGDLSNRQVQAYLRKWR